MLLVPRQDRFQHATPSSFLIQFHWMTSTPCIVCKSLDTRPCLRARDYHYGISGEFSLVRCVGCGLVHLDPIPTTDELAEFYSRDYYAYQPVGKPGKLKLLIRRLLGIMIKTHNPTFLHPGEFVDIGCGSGDYLHQMSAEGWRVRGVEPSKFVECRIFCTGWSVSVAQRVL
jgi:hypothetical protein